MALISSGLRHICRFGLFVAGLYLLPWARLCDISAVRIAKVVPRIIPWTWHVSGLLLTTIVTIHVAVIVSVLAQLEFGGSGNPACVCEASVYAVGLRQQTSTKALIASCFDVCRATLNFVAAVTRVFSDCCVVILSFPKTSMCVTCLVVVAFSVAP